MSHGYRSGLDPQPDLQPAAAAQQVAVTKRVFEDGKIIRQITGPASWPQTPRHFHPSLPPIFCSLSHSSASHLIPHPSLSFLSSPELSGPSTLLLSSRPFQICCFCSHPSFTVRLKGWGKTTEHLLNLEPDTSDGMFDMSMRYISHFHLGRSP